VVAEKRFNLDHCRANDNTLTVINLRDISCPETPEKKQEAGIVCREK
jgi:hypothetical protein